MRARLLINREKIWLLTIGKISFERHIIVKNGLLLCVEDMLYRTKRSKLFVDFLRLKTSITACKHTVVTKSEGR